MRTNIKYMLFCYFMFYVIFNKLSVNLLSVNCYPTYCNLLSANYYPTYYDLLSVNYYPTYI